jgi:hypothetical protein
MTGREREAVCKEVFKSLEVKGASIAKDPCLTYPKGSLLAVSQITSRIFGDRLAICWDVPTLFI